MTNTFEEIKVPDVVARGEMLQGPQALADAYSKLTNEEQARFRKRRVLKVNRNAFRKALEAIPNYELFTAEQFVNLCLVHDMPYHAGWQCYKDLWKKL